MPLARGPFLVGSFCVGLASLSLVCARRASLSGRSEKPNADLADDADCAEVLCRDVGVPREVLSIGWTSVAVRGISRLCPELAHHA